MNKKWIMRVAFFMAFVFGVCSAHAQSSKTAVPPMDEEVKQQITEISQLFKENPEKANESFLKMLRKVKDKEQLVALGQYLVQEKNYPYAKLCGDKAYEIDATYIPTLMLCGEVCILRKDWGGAGQKFDEALLVDSTLTEAMLKNAQVYKYVNPEVAKQMLHKLKAQDPNFTDADRMLGDIAYFLDEYKEAAEYYGTYFTTAKDSNISAMRNYVLSLFAVKQHEKSLEFANAALRRDVNDVSMLRMKFYNLCELKRFDEAAQAAAYIENGQFADSVLTAGDYDNLGKVKMQNSDFATAEKCFKKALQISPESFAVYKNLSNCYKNSGQYDKSIESFRVYMDSIGNKANMVDSLDMGKLYQMALQGAGDSVSMDVKQKYLTEGNKIFAFITQHSPSFWGPMWQARINNVLTGNKPDDTVYGYYMEAFNRLKDKEGNNYLKTEALRYFAFYTLQKDQYPQCKEWCQKILEIDPTDDLATRIMSALKNLK